MSKFDKGRLGRISAWMQDYVDQRKYAGCSVLIAHQGQEVFFNATGQRDITAGLAFERDTVARIYSMTKPITSVALMILAEKGLFHLDAPVSDFIPEFKEPRCLVPGASDVDQTEPCAVPTLHHLLTHTSGMSYRFNPGLLAKLMEEKDIIFRADQGPLADMVTQAAALPLAFAPGSRWEYSIGIDIIGRVVEVVSGKSLEEFLIEEIFDPLGMDETRFSVPESARDRFAALYTPLAGGAMNLNDLEKSAETLREVDNVSGSPFLQASMHSGGGGLVGTIDDYLKFAEMIRTGGGGILSPKTMAYMMRNHLAGDIASMGPQSFAEQPMEGMGFGLGGSVLLEPGRARSIGSVGEYGWGGMASTFFWVDPVEQLSVVFFTQLAPSSSYPSRSQLKALVHGAMM